MTQAGIEPATSSYSYWCSSPLSYQAIDVYRGSSSLCTGKWASQPHRTLVIMQAEADFKLPLTHSTSCLMLYYLCSRLTNKTSKKTPSSSTPSPTLIFTHLPEENSSSTPIWSHQDNLQPDHQSVYTCQSLPQSPPPKSLVSAHLSKVARYPSIQTFKSKELLISPPLLSGGVGNTGQQEQKYHACTPGRDWPQGPR